jgi:hypothetical protein
MPTRLIREGIIDSRAVNALTEAAEIIYRRLMSVVDDYGRFEADAELIRARCFPRQLERWKPERVEKYLAECATVNDGESPLLTVYHAGTRKYLQINNFGQRVQSKSKFPGPESGVPQQPEAESQPCLTVDHEEKPPSRMRMRSRISNANAESLDASPKNDSAKTHGSRLTVETIPPEWAAWCESDLGWITERAESVFLSFRDYWIAKPGKDGRKANWLATWRGWCRRERGSNTTQGKRADRQAEIDAEWAELAK